MDCLRIKEILRKARTNNVNIPGIIDVVNLIFPLLFGSYQSEYGLYIIEILLYSLSVQYLRKLNLK